MSGMEAATKVIPFLPSEKTDKKEMDGGCNEGHSLVAVRKDRQKGNGWRLQRRSFPFRRQKRQTNRKWMADATKVSPLLPSETTDKKEMDGGCNESLSLFAVRKDTQKRNGRRMQRKSSPFCQLTNSLAIAA